MSPRGLCRNPSVSWKGYLPTEIRQLIFAVEIKNSLLSCLLYKMTLQLSNQCSQVQFNPTGDWLNVCQMYMFSPSKLYVFMPKFYYEDILVNSQICTLNICRLPIFLTVSFFVDSIYCDWRKYLEYLESKARKLLILNAYGLYVVFNDGNSIYPLNTPPSQVFSVHFQISSIVFPNQLKLLF